jgi:hypothetical protein
VNAVNLIGLDLGKESDPAALCVLNRRIVPASELPELPAKPEKHGPAKPKGEPSWDEIRKHDAQQAELERWKERNPYISGEAAFDADLMVGAPNPGRTERRYLCRGLRRWPLGTNYRHIRDEVRTLCGHPMLQQTVDGKIERPTLIVDATGLGGPFLDMLTDKDLPARLVALTITGGNKIRVDEDRSNYWYVPKFILVRTFEILLQTGRIDFPPKLIDPATHEDLNQVLKGELADFRFRKKASDKTGKITESFEAEAGSHDDVLMAVSYSCWWGERGGRTPKIW